MDDDNQHPKVDFSGSGPVVYSPATSASQGKLQQTLVNHEAALFAVPGVTSVGIGFGPAGQEALTVGVVDAGVAAALPSEIDGFPVVVMVTGEVDALPRR